jgi:glucose-6-phosphate 1-dehydrogenase
MTQRESDALAIFGATGALSYKKIFPSLQSMAKRRALSFPVVGVGREAWDVERIRARARESLEKNGGGVDGNAFERLAGLLRFVGGDYAADSTFEAQGKTLGEAK